MLLSMAIVLHHRPLVRRSGEAIQVVIIEPPVHPVIPPESTTPARPIAKRSLGRGKTDRSRKNLQAHPPNATPRMSSAPAINANSAIAMPERPALASLSAEGGDSQASGGSGPEDGAAHAIYVPPPQIPDDLREDILQAEAIALFTVSPDGDVAVKLTKATDNPRLNQVLLDALRRWKFFPAISNGIAINSTVEVRIPISVL
jgi:protein TonB